MRLTYFCSAILFIVICNAWAANKSAPPTVPSASPTPSELSGFNLSLRSAVAASLSKLGQLEPWQKVLFDEEVLPQYQRFILNYSGGDAQSSNVDVDVKGIQNYLGFYAPLALHLEKPQIVVRLLPEASCSKCMTALSGIKQLTALRLQRRGFTPLWVTQDDLLALKTSGKTTAELLADLASSKNAQGFLLIEWKMVPAEPDSPHGDELHFTIASQLSLPTAGTHSGQLELLEQDAFEPAAARLLTDAFVQFSGSALVVKANDSHLEEVTITVTGVLDFRNYQEIKNGLEAKLANIAVLQERKISRGQAVFAVQNGKTAEQIREILQGLPFHMEIK